MPLGKLPAYQKEGDFEKITVVFDYHQFYAQHIGLFEGRDVYGAGRHLQGYIRKKCQSTAA